MIGSVVKGYIESFASSSPKIVQLYAVQLLLKGILLTTTDREREKIVEDTANIFGM